MSRHIKVLNVSHMKNKLQDLEAPFILFNLEIFVAKDATYQQGSKTRLMMMMMMMMHTVKKL